MSPETTSILQYGALGILGVVVLTGMGLFVWVIRWFLPKLLDLVTQATAHLITALDKISNKQTTLAQAVDEINERLEQGDKKFDEILAELRARR